MIRSVIRLSSSVFLPVQQQFTGCKIVADISVRKTERPIEAKRFGFGSDVPLSGDSGVIAGATQHLGNGYTPGHVLVVQFDGSVPSGVSRLIGMQPGQQRHPRRVALARIVEPTKTQSALRQLVQVRRLDFSAIATEVGVPHVIYHDDNDIGPFRRPAQADGSKQARKRRDCADSVHFLNSS